MPRKPNAAFLKPQQPDAVLAAIIGAKPISRPEITKRLWAYIKANALQSSVNRRVIVAGNADFEDSMFRALIGGADNCSMFELPKYVGQHITPAEG